MKWGDHLGVVEVSRQLPKVICRYRRTVLYSLQSTALSRKSVWVWLKE